MLIVYILLATVYATFAAAYVFMYTKSVSHAILNFIISFLILPIGLGVTIYQMIKNRSWKLPPIKCRIK